MLTWHISLNGCHGNDSPFGERLCSMVSSVTHKCTVYYLLQWMLDFFLCYKLWVFWLERMDGWMNCYQFIHHYFPISFFFFFSWTEATCFWIKRRTQQLHSHTVDTMRSASTETELSECFGRCECNVRVPQVFHIKVTESIWTWVCASVLCLRVVFCSEGKSTWFHSLLTLCCCLCSYSLPQLFTYNLHSCYVAVF